VEQVSWYASLKKRRRCYMDSALVAVLPRDLCPFVYPKKDFWYMSIHLILYAIFVRRNVETAPPCERDYGKLVWIYGITYNVNCRSRLVVAFNHTSCLMEYLLVVSRWCWGVIGSSLRCDRDAVELLGLNKFWNRYFSIHFPGIPT
jgi:hypothetical protein